MSRTTDRRTRGAGLAIALSMLCLLPSCASIDGRQKLDVARSEGQATPSVAAAVAASNADNSTSGASAKTGAPAASRTGHDDPLPVIFTPPDIWQKFTALDDDLQCAQLS